MATLLPQIHSYEPFNKFLGDLDLTDEEKEFIRNLPLTGDLIRSHAAIMQFRSTKIGESNAREATKLAIATTEYAKQSAENAKHSAEYAKQSAEQARAYTRLTGWIAVAAIVQAVTAIVIAVKS